MGGYFPDVIRMFPFFERRSPLGALSALKLERPEETDDGPIMWANVSAWERGIGEETRTVCYLFIMILLFIYFHFLRVGRNEVQSVSWRPRASQLREILFKDRTPCHADHVGHGSERCTTAAVGLLKAIYTQDR